MNNLPTEPPTATEAEPLPYFDAPSARRFLSALGRIYRQAGLPRRLAVEAACADYRSFGLPLLYEG